MGKKQVTLVLLVIGIASQARANTRFFVKLNANASELFKTRPDHSRVLGESTGATVNPINDRMKTGFHQYEDERLIKDLAAAQQERRNSFETSTFNPDVLNRFLEEYANKIKSTTEKNLRYPYRVINPTVEPLLLEIDDANEQTSTAGYDEGDKFEENNSNSTVVSEEGLADTLNDTLKRNKYYGANSYDDRNGWVTLEAIPWSKSKISKWQANNPSTQRPWPEMKPWEKPSIAKPWTADYSVRPIYENNKPWYEKPKPTWPESSNEKPWHKPTPRPSYYDNKHEEAAAQSQKWPPERPSWNKYPDSLHGSSDIITDDRPSNFPNTWSRPPATKPSASYQFVDRFHDKSQPDDNDWNDFPSRYESLNDRLRPSSERPNFSQYQYENSHPPTYPANGDGQWILLSTNRGYSKSRQRSIKLDGNKQGANGSKSLTGHREENDPAIAVMTSKRQVRLTVLPSINGTNTTTSHGGLLEVEKTFKSVDQSRKEYELGQLTTTDPTILKKRPIRHTLAAQPSNSAVLAAIGAGMLPATMAMMIPMILGRRKRDLATTNIFYPTKYPNPPIDLRDLRNRNAKLRRFQ